MAKNYYKNVEVVENIDSWKSEVARRFHFDRYDTTKDLVEEFIRCGDASYYYVELTPRKSTDVIVAYMDQDKKRYKYCSVFDVINEKFNKKVTPYDLLNKIKAVNIRRDNTNYQDLYSDKPGSYRNRVTQFNFMSDVLLTYYIYTEQYRKAAMLTRMALSKAKDVIIGNRGTYYYKTTDKDFALGAIESLVLLYGGRNDKALVNNSTGKKLIENYYNSISKISDLDAYIFKNETLKEFHSSVMRVYSRRLNKISLSRDSSVFDSLKTQYGSFAFESNPLFLEATLELIDRRCRGGSIKFKNDWYFGEFAKEDKKYHSDAHRDHLISVFQNYFYTKYGRGQKYSNLEKYLSAAVKFINGFGYDINVLDLIVGLPDKIQTAALRGELGSF